MSRVLCFVRVLGGVSLGRLCSGGLTFFGVGPRHKNDPACPDLFGMLDRSPGPFRFISDKDFYLDACLQASDTDHVSRRNNQKEQ